MAINKKAHFRGNDFNNQELKDAKSLQLNEDAVNSDEAVRKSQAEAISDQSAQDILVALSQDASNTTAFTSASMVGFLNGKQNNMEIHPDSASYLQLVDGYKIKATQLLITDVEVNSTCTDLQMFIDTYSPSKQEGDVVILTNASDNQLQSWIKTGLASQGVDGYARLQTDYNVTTIRTMFSSGTYLSYDEANGQFGLILGNLSGELGAHTLPINENEFSVITGNTVLQVAKNLEALVQQVEQSGNDGTATVNTRLTNLSGVSGANLGVFAQGIFSDNSTVKAVLIESENAHKNATDDRANIRTELATAQTNLQNNIDAEETARISAISSEASSRQAQDNTLQNNIDATNQSLANETARAINAENGLDARLDVIEGTGTGSINKAQADAQIFATQLTVNEANLRAIADNGLQLQIDAISSAFLYKGYVGADGRVQHIDTLHANHNLPFENIALFNGDFYKINASLTITFSDNSTIEVEAGDGLLGIADIASGSVTSAHIHKTDNTESADILREGQLDATHLERVAGTIKVKDDSLGREKLANDVETDIDNKVLKAGDTMTGALKVDKVVTTDGGYVGGYDYAMYVKQKSVGGNSLTDTQRALLVENEVYTNGSGNPLDLDYANATTSASHYKGASVDMSVATVGTNSEANVDNPASAIYATGAYGSATSNQLGVNAGGTFVAQNGSTANLGVFSFTDTAGALNNRAGYFALAPDSLDFDGYRVARVANPLPVQDVVMLLDDYTGTKHALYVNGKSEFTGKVILPSATADNEAVNLGDVKAKEYFEEFSIDANGNTVINHGLGSKKLVLSIWHNDEEATSSFDIEKTSSNSITIYNGTSEALSGLEICIYKLSV